MNNYLTKEDKKVVRDAAGSGITVYGGASAWRSPKICCFGFTVAGSPLRIELNMGVLRLCGFGHAQHHNAKAADMAALRAAARADLKAAGGRTMAREANEAEKAKAKADAKAEVKVK